MSKSRAVLLLNPDEDQPGCLAREVTDVLSSMPLVRSISVFGSLANDSADRWSDVDMLVACDGPQSGFWIAVSMIRDAKPVLFYRTFYSPASPQPSGRYWFADKSPFNRLDVSFHSVEEYEGLIREPSRFGYDVSYREMYRASQSFDGTGIVPEDPHPISISDLETEVGGCVYGLLNRMKAYLRGKKPFSEVSGAAERLRNSLEGVPLGAVMAGGRIGLLAYDVLDMADHLQKEYGPTRADTGNGGCCD